MGGGWGGREGREGGRKEREEMLEREGRKLGSGDANGRRGGGREGAR